MDIVHRLRIVIWLLILGLWGLMVYQYIGDEQDNQPGRQMATVDNPYKGIAPPEVPDDASATAGSPTSDPLALARQAALAAQSLQSQPEQVAAATPAPPEPAPAATATPPPTTDASSLDYVRSPGGLSAPSQAASPPSRAAAAPPAHHERMRREFALKNPDPPIPPGFVKTVTRHFNIYSETDPPSQDFLDMIETIHGNLMLDLAAFSPWANEQRVSIFLFRNQKTYLEVTGRPAWSGGASSVPRRKVYVFESQELPSILAHELTHIFYDGFYLDGSPDPLWLSEGMATLSQVERGLAAPNWLRDNLQLLENGGGFPIEKLMAVTTTANMSDDQVRLWYAQSYSIVRFLIRSQRKASFYKFSEYIREGKDVTQSLYRSYGMPFNRVKALEYAWRYDLTSRSMSRLARSSDDNF